METQLPLSEIKLVIWWYPDVKKNNIKISKSLPTRCLSVFKETPVLNHKQEEKQFRKGNIDPLKIVTK